MVLLSVLFVHGKVLVEQLTNAITPTTFHKHHQQFPLHHTNDIQWTSTHKITLLQKKHYFNMTESLLNMIFWIICFYSLDVQHKLSSTCCMPHSHHSYLFLPISYSEYIFTYICYQGYGQKKIRICIILSPFHEE